MTPDLFSESFAVHARVDQCRRNYVTVLAREHYAAHTPAYAVTTRPILWARAVYWLHQFEAADIRDTFAAQVMRVWLEALITALEAQSDAGNVAALDALYMRLMDARYGVAAEIDTRTVGEARIAFDNALALATAYDDEQYAAEAREAEKRWHDMQAITWEAA